MSYTVNGPLRVATEDVPVHAVFLAEHIAPPYPADWPIVATNPTLLEAPGGGHAAVFRYGAVVFFGVDRADRRTLRQALQDPKVEGSPEPEEALVRIDSRGRARATEGHIVVPELSTAYLQIIAVALARSIVLEHYELAIAESFLHIEPLSRDLRAGKPPGRKMRLLLTHIGEALLAEHRMIGRVEVHEKPDLLWDAPELERFYVQLEAEYDLKERETIIERKLELMSRTAQTALELQQDRRALRVEWYIVLLIVLEILLTLYQMWAP